MAFDITVILSVAGAFGAASTAQYFSHQLTLKREDEKYRKECYQNLYSPLMFKIISYLNAEECHRSQINLNFTPKPDVFLKEIVKILEENLKYADPRLIGLYEMIRTKYLLENNFANDKPKNNEDKFLESMEYNEKMQIFEEFTIEYLKVSNQLDILSNKFEKKVHSVLAIIKLYNLLEGFSFHEAASFIRSNGSMVVSLLTPRYTLDKIEEVHTNVQESLETRERHTGKISVECYNDLVAFLTEVNSKISGMHYLEGNLKTALDEDLDWITIWLHRTGNR